MHTLQQADPYYGRPEVSNSDLSALRKDAMSAKDMLIFEQACKFGRLIDCMITEPHQVAEHELMCSGEYYTAEDFARAREMRRAYMANELCRSLLKRSDCQKVMINAGQVFEYRGRRFVLDTRCKWDLWMQLMGWGADIKSTTAVTRAQFIEACRYFCYDQQRAWYMDMASSPKDLLIGLSKKQTDQVFLLPIERGDDFYLSGREKYLKLAWELYERRAA